LYIVNSASIFELRTSAHTLSNSMKCCCIIAFEDCGPYLPIRDEYSHILYSFSFTFK
jgi:hypothetical protein